MVFIVPVIANTASQIGSDEYHQRHSDLVIDSLHTQEPPGPEIIPETMVASFYGNRFHGKKTANGERFDKNLLTCAHNTLPFNTILHVTNPRNGKTVTVRVNDRGPFIRGRQLDLSYAAARELGMLKAGVIKVEVRNLGIAGEDFPTPGSAELALSSTE
ncbi:MAG: septal ring lytic transglycosylase RlpA family protein [Candidatus Cloacimonetes bacterium]|nr:septal ring lytic transglycosylase RlpA family protein [Candidatus Cloacimonadota bacterium]